MTARLTLLDYLTGQAVAGLCRTPAPPDQDQAEAIAEAALRVAQAAAARLDREQGRDEQPEGDRLLSMDEVARQLQCSRPTIYKYIREDGLPCVKVGQYRRFRAADVKEFAAQLPRLAVYASQGEGE